MKRLVFAIAAVAAGLAVGAPTAAEKAEAEELLKVIDDNRVKYDCWCVHYAKKRYAADFAARMCGERTAETADGVLERALGAYRRYLELRPGDWGRRHEYAEALKVKGDWQAALAEYAKMESPKVGGWERARLSFETADAYMGAGDRAAAIRVLEQYAALKINPWGGRRQEQYSGECLDALKILKGECFDGMKLPLYTGAKPFPKPQQAEYAEAFARLEKVAIRLDGLEESDARVRLLKAKLDRLGVESETVGWFGALFASGYRLTVAIDAEAPVERPEGYSLVTAEDGAEIRARDAQGALWGIVSFVQMIDPEAKAVRLGRVRDWPDGARRGYLGAFWADATEFTLFQKMNSVTFQRYWSNYARNTPLRRFMTAELTRQFRELGLEIYFRIVWAAEDLGAPYTKRWTRDYVTEVCKDFAKIGAGVYYPNDDCRYVPEALPKEDLATGLRPSDFDAPFLSNVFVNVKREYPDFKMIYCPPFYWGPDSGASYPDDREKYLKSMRQLPPEVDLYWTGGQVKGYNKSKRQVKWFTDLTGHKPTIFQNGTGPHNLLGYVVDETDWNGWHYPGFFEEDIACFHKNSHTPTECCQITTLADCLWNVKGYDKRESVERGVNQLLGREMYGILAPGLPALAYFDKYKYGALTADILHENIDDLKAKVALAKACWAKAVAYNPAVASYGAYDRGIGWAEQVVKGAAKPPDFLAKYRKLLGPARELAEKETGFDKAKGDLLYLPTDMTGPQMGVYDHHMLKEPGRFVKFLRGCETPFSGAEFSFECDPFPPAGDYELWIRGMDDEVEGLNPLQVSVNGKVVFSGEPGFPEKAYALRKFTIPFDSMKRYNRVRIANLGKGANPNGPPYVAICYAVVKKAK